MKKIKNAPPELGVPMVGAQAKQKVGAHKAGAKAQHRPAQHVAKVMVVCASKEVQRSSFVSADFQTYMVPCHSFRLAHRV